MAKKEEPVILKQYKGDEIKVSDFLRDVLTNYFEHDQDTLTILIETPTADGVEAEIELDIRIVSLTTK